MNNQIIVDKTKIITTIGPATNDIETLREIIKAGADVCRLNFSHGTQEDHLDVINKVRQLNKELGTTVALLADLQGPKIRLGKIKNDEIIIEKDQELILRTSLEDCVEDEIFITYDNFARDVRQGELIQVDDGKILLEVVETDLQDRVKVKVNHGGPLRSRKGVNLPNTKISLPCLTPKDIDDLAFAIDHKVHWVALSFVRSAADLIELRHVIRQMQPEFMPHIIAKIEKPEALEDIESIIDKADAIMVARGDLGIEIPLQRLPLTQKMLAKKCLSKSTPIIIATQMMEGMIDNYNPTRAEVNDVANSVMDGADTLMLSGETSVGKHPVQVVKTMQKVIEEIETSDNEIYYKYESDKTENEREISDAVIFSACKLAEKTKANAIVGMTYSGYSAFRIAAHRPKANIYVFTENKHLMNKLNLIWGVRGFYYDKFISTDHSMEDIQYRLQKDGYVKKGDKIVFISSTPLFKNAKTNMIKLSVVE